MGFQSCHHAAPQCGHPQWAPLPMDFRAEDAHFCCKQQPKLGFYIIWFPSIPLFLVVLVVVVDGKASKNVDYTAAANGGRVSRKPQSWWVLLPVILTTHSHEDLLTTSQLLTHTSTQGRTPSSTQALG